MTFRYFDPTQGVRHLNELQKAYYIIRYRMKRYPIQQKGEFQELSRNSNLFCALPSKEYFQSFENQVA